MAEFKDCLTGYLCVELSLSAVRLYIGARVVINLREAPIIINRLSRTCTLCNGLWRRETPSLKPYNRLATPL